MIERPDPFTTNVETYRWLVTIAGRCNCPSGECSSTCLLCQLSNTMDTALPCPHDPTDAWPTDVVAG